MKMFLKKWRTLMLLGIVAGCTQGIPQCGSLGGNAGGCGCLSAIQQMPTLDKAPPVEVSVLLPKFDCSQAPTSEHCFEVTKIIKEGDKIENKIVVSECIPDNPATLWNEQTCCESFKTIKQARLDQGLTPEQSDATPFSEAEAKQYQSACCEFPDPGLHDCCMAVMTKGGDLTVCAKLDQAPQIPAISLDCHADSPDDQASGPCAADGISCTFSISKGGGPAPFTCEPKTGTSAKALKLDMDQAALDMIQSVQWIQVRGSKKVKIEGKTQGGEPLTGSSILFEASKSLATEPIDLTMKGSAPPASSAVGKEGWETFQFMAIMKDVNGNPLNTAIGLINVTNGDAFSGGGCGCQKGELVPSERARGIRSMLVYFVLVLIPWFYLRRRMLS